MHVLNPIPIRPGYQATYEREVPRAIHWLEALHRVTLGAAGQMPFPES